MSILTRPQFGFLARSRPLAEPVEAPCAASVEAPYSGEYEAHATRRARLRTTPSLWIGGILTAALVLAAICGPALAPYAPDRVLAGPRLTAPGAAYFFGTDTLGRDMASRILYGARLALAMALFGVGIASVLGIIPGLLAGYHGGRLDQCLSRVMDVWLAFPGMLLALVIVARLGPSFRNTILALGIAGAPGFYRLARGLTLSVRHAAYIEAARSVGAADSRILLRHILPNLSASLLVLATGRAGVLLLAGGALSFLGLGAQPPTPEWGALLAAGRTQMDAAPWLAIFPGLCLTLAVVGFNLLGDGLRDLLTPCQ